jgi:hypothetical protein
MAQMYERFLYGSCAPFANQCADVMSMPSTHRQHGLIPVHQAEQRCRQGQVHREHLPTAVNKTGTVGVNADDVGVREIRGIREGGTCFYYAIIDTEKQKIQDGSQIGNYCGERTPTSINQPCLIFIINDSLPKSEFCNQMRILLTYVSFLSNPEDPGFYAAQKPPQNIPERRNLIFSHVAHRLLNRHLWAERTGASRRAKRNGLLGSR